MKPLSVKKRGGDHERMDHTREHCVARSPRRCSPCYFYVSWERNLYPDELGASGRETQGRLRDGYRQGRPLSLSGPPFPPAITMLRNNRMLIEIE